MNLKLHIKNIIIALCVFFISSLSLAQTKTTTVEENTTEVQATGKTPTKNNKKNSTPVTTSTSSSSTTTTVQVEQPRKVITEDTLRKIANTLCTEGFKAYVGTDKKNICGKEITAPDIAYTCVWDKKGKMAYAPTAQGPCNLDFTEHRGSIAVTKEKFNSNPPLSYGTEVQCCYRAAKSPASSN